MARIINEMTLLRVKQTTCAADTHVTSSSQQLSHRAKAICGVSSYTFNPWFHHPYEIFVMAYFLWEMVASIRFKITVLRNYLFCKWLWNIACHSEKERVLHSSGMLHRVTEYIVTDVSGKCSGPMFQVEVSKTKKTSSSSFRQLDKWRTGSRLCGMKDVWSVLWCCSFI